jgi:molybdopterin-guanine dinucleotide biosynthesis protein A
LKLLGAIIAGGQGRRFGGDKGSAEVDGRALIDHVADAVGWQVDDVIICGRKWPSLTSIEDRPMPDLGPLGGLNSALAHAQQKRFDGVLTAGCDVLPVPDLRALVGPGPAVIEGQPLFGYWPVSLAPLLAEHVRTTTDRSMRHWLTVCDARIVKCDTALHNINTPDDLALYCATQGLAA